LGGINRFTSVADAVDGTQQDASQSAVPAGSALPVTTPAVDEDE
jgi:hypothetical protein